MQHYLRKDFHHKFPFFIRFTPIPQTLLTAKIQNQLSMRKVFFIYYLAAPLLTLGYCRGDSLSNPMLITTFPQMGHSEILWKIAVKKDI